MPFYSEFQIRNELLSCLKCTSASHVDGDDQNTREKSTNGQRRQVPILQVGLHRPPSTLRPISQIPSRLGVETFVIVTWKGLCPICSLGNVPTVTSVWEVDSQSRVLTIQPFYPSPAAPCVSLIPHLAEALIEQTAPLERPTLAAFLVLLGLAFLS